MKCYVLMISSIFPKTHIRKGYPTCFKPKINRKEKRHTIRNNYDLWRKRMDEVLKGNAYISLREWEGLPYKSKQTEIKKITKADDPEVQKLLPYSSGFFVDDYSHEVDPTVLAVNDGLSRIDFMHWFGENFQEPKAIIHFSDFRY